MRKLSMATSSVQLNSGKKAIGVKGSWRTAEVDSGRSLGERVSSVSVETPRLKRSQAKQRFGIMW